MSPDVSTLPAAVPRGSRWGFYGWWMLGIVVITNLMSAPGQTSGFAPFVEPVMNATGLTRQSLANVYLVATLLSAGALTLAGRALDRWGCRVAVVSANLGMAAVLLLMSQVGRWGSGIAAIGMLLIGLAGMRFTGQGVMMLAGQTTTARWFVKRRGFAIGIVGVAGALMGPFSPMLLDLLIQQVGWRNTWLVAAGIIGVGNTLLVWWLWKDTPEKVGLTPDGLSPDASEDGESAGDPSWNRSQAVRVPLFWIVAASGLMLAMIITAVSFHIVHLAEGHGLPRDQALRYFVPMGWTAMILGFGLNVLADRCSYRWFLPLQQLALAAAIMVLNFTPFFMLSAVLLGVALSLAGPVGATTLPRWFGRRHLGAIGSITWAAVVIGSAIGPALFSADQANGYLNLTIVCTFILCMLLAGSALFPEPKYRPDN